MFKGCAMSETITAPAANNAEQNDTDIVAKADKAAETLQQVKTAIGKIIYGQNDVVEQALTTVLAGGHGLLVGVPGLAKTKLVDTMGVVLGLNARRIQFTPDLMPSDILGSEVLEQAEDGSRNFRFIKGPIFGQLLMADEINRASPRTQSALLQAMQEYHVTIAGERFDLPEPFHVLATQNPLEQEGTYPLPEAQLDRFLMQIDVLYPELDAERQILLETTGSRDASPEAVLTPESLLEMQTLVRSIPVGEKVVDGILSLVRAARPEGNDEDGLTRHVAWGPGPRAGQALMLTCRARALLDGRLAPSLDDVAALAGPVLQHRMAVTFAARADGISVRKLIADLVEAHL